ncbi:MAG: type VI secretion system baseplate subunit TssK [Planctomycetales bacterium]|nr:type VI secretion system baseplate subunit TssK [Planctomycetales bacterium]
MKNLPVHWYEGLFLRPQHLQASERSWSEHLQTSHQWDTPYHYGLMTLEFSPEALANHQFQLHRLQARMRDGTLVNLQVGQEPDRLDLEQAIAEARLPSVEMNEAFEETSVLRVYLGIPKLTMGRANVSESAAEPTRFVETSLSVQDESQGGNDQLVEFRALNVRLLLSTQDLTGYELLPIAQIKRASDGEAKPQLDTTYIPPLLSIGSWPGLGRDIVRATYDVIGQKIQVMSQQLMNRGIGLDSQDPGDLERILMLSQLNTAFSTLSVLAFAQGIHPLTAYTEMCRVLGQLSIFGPDRRPPDIPAYNHEDLHSIFSLLRERIEQRINSVRDYSYQQRYFVGVGLGMQISLEPRWFNSDFEWYIGVHKGELTTKECLDLLSPGNLDWKLGSSRQVEILFRHRAEGIHLRPLDRNVRALPSRSEWVYFEVSKQDSPAWRDVQETQTLAMRLQDSLIVNRDRLQGERRLVVSSRGNNVALEFALFAVPAEL